MALKENKYYWEKSLRHPEPAADDFYVFDKVIVSDANLVENVRRLRELIISYCVVTEKDKSAAAKILDEIYSIIISIDKIQYTEFVAFWKTLDMSYSVFEKLPNQKIILNELLQKYCEKRRKLYDKLGYSDVVVQALYDSGTSRKKGVSGIDKLTSLVPKTVSINIPHVRNMRELINSSTAYFLPDKRDKDLFREFCKNFKIKYDFGRDHQGKEPDIVFKINNRFFIIEAKHIKESGGAQAKQIVELIEFIKYSEDSDTIHYISFMDGVYFNNFIWVKDSNDTKANRQRKAIEENLSKHKKNFFVNTAGLLSLFKDAIEKGE
ncbi:MAG: hypothetical protein NC816_03045 [Candidatus Omnitrophica bacterium]|nr:hypothetical protein [Candidatus Omnitrophota bacterium]